MAKLEIPVVVDISGIESLIDEIKHLQTYKLSSEDEQILVDRDDVVKIFADHVRANIKPERKKGKWIVVDDGIISGKCSVCGWEAYMYEDDVVGMDYCPNCGVRMEGTE